MKFHKKPIAIEAQQWTGENGSEIADWAGSRNVVFAGGVPHMFTREGVMTASIGDWIIKGIAGEFYPCKPDIFAATYEPAE